MRNLLLSATAMLFCVFLTYGQQNYTVVSLGTNYSIQDINAAFSTANLCNNIYKDIRRDIVLDDGAVLQLFSASELGNAQGCGLDSSIQFKEEQWGISPNGKIIIKKPATLNKQL